MTGLAPKLTTWILLVACLLTSLAPATELVLCLEPGGRVALEVAADNPCCERVPAAGAGASVEGGGEDGVGCACIDIPLVRSSDEPQAKPRHLPTSFQWVAAPPASGAALVLAAAARPATLLLPCGEPRPAPRLALIRTVILRV